MNLFNYSITPILQVIVLTIHFCQTVHLMHQISETYEIRLVLFILYNILCSNVFIYLVFLAFWKIIRKMAESVI